MIISRTPYRISLLGGGTDYPTWFMNGKNGSVLSFTINHYCHIMVRRLPPFFEYKNVISYADREYTQTIEGIKHPAVREILKYFNQPNGVELIHSGDLPARSGMGSSSSFTVGLVNILYHMAPDGSILNFVMDGKMLKRILALEAIHIERDILKENVGCQDQIAAAYGGLNIIEFDEFEFNVEPVLVPIRSLRKLQDHLVLCYTKVVRTASEVAGTYVHTLPDKTVAMNKLNSFVHDGMNCIMDGNMAGLGKLLNASWEIKKSLSPITTNPTIDQIYALAMANGAYGGKLLGAGGGGFMLWCVPPNKRLQLLNAMAKFNLVNVPIQIEFEGSKIIFS